MAIPSLVKDGLLPEGVHNCTVEELQEQFGGTRHGDRRSALFASLLDFIQELSSTGMAVAVIVDGSFVTSKLEPNDIDLVLVLFADHDFSSTLRPFEYNVLSRRRVRKRFPFDVLIARDNSPELVEYFEFFQQIRGEPGRRKGILRVQL